jgi:nitrite reductase/ring-hydroxylating ferredoxin subunit
MSLRYEFVPPYADSRMDHVGTYKRTLPVSLERMYENALDWEHLPHLHSSSFTDIECIDSGGWGWRAQVTGANGVKSLLELRLDRDCRRWITRNLAGPNQGAEIWTHVFVTAPQQMDIVIDFFVPGVPEQSREKVGRAYARQYELLYDEDVWMMSERQVQIDRRLDSIRTEEQVTLSMPSEEDLPLPVELSGRQFMISRYAQQWVVYPAACPHQLGPLTGDVTEQGEVVCPWHGYRFDVLSGECTLGGQCRFGRRPELTVADSSIVLSWSAQASSTG